MKIPSIYHPAPGSKQRYEMLLQLMQIADRMTRVGFRVDREAITRHYNKALERRAKFSEKFLALTHLPAEALGEAGAGQTKTVRQFFLNTCNAPVVSRDKITKQPQINTAALVEYATKYGTSDFGPAAAALYALRKNIKSAQFCYAYDLLSVNDSRIHSSFFPFGTKTGRWSSGTRIYQPDLQTTVGVNLQQIPSQEPTFEFKKGEHTKLISSLRDIFIADDNCQIFSWDYDALEVRLIAYIFGVKNMIAEIEAADARGDETHGVHWFTAKNLFKELVGKKPDKLLRTAAKGCSYAITYMMHDTKGGARGYKTMQKALREKLPGVPIDDTATKLIVDRFFALYPEIKQAQLAVQKQVASQGYREIPINGRRLHYPNATRGWNQALNATFQGTGAELINRAVIEVDKICRYEPGHSYIVAQCHDEIVCNVRNDEAEKIDAWVKRCMSAPADLGSGTVIGIPSKSVRGPCWPK